MPSIQFELDDEEQVTALYALMGKVAMRERKKVGLGTVAKKLLESLLSHPELVKQFMDDDPGTLPLAAEKRPEYTTSPKAKSQPRGKKDAA